MRKLSLLALIVFSVFLSSCSFSTTLVVINRSDRPVEVRYRFKETPGPFSPPRPSTKAIAELDNDSLWQDLTAEQYVVDGQSRTITVTVAPKIALRVDNVRGPGIPDDATSFPISEIVMRGAYGTVILHGEQARKGFVKEEDARGAYSITYR